MKINIPGLDVESGLDVCGGDLGIYQYSLNLYVTSIPAFLEKMRLVSKETNVSAETMHDYSITVHSLKAISEYVGAKEARATAKQLEAMAKEGNIDGIKAQNETYIKYLEKLVSEIQNWLDHNKTE